MSAVRYTPSPPPQGQSRTQINLQITVPDNQHSYRQIAGSYATPIDGTHEARKNETPSLGDMDVDSIASPHDTQTLLEKLREAPNIVTNDTLSDASFESITQLPTPIINSGSFGSLSPMETSFLEVQKLRRHPLLKQNRIISEYKPIDRKLYMPHRVSSYPTEQLEKETPGKSPDGSADESYTGLQLHGLTKFYSKKFDREFTYVKIIGKGSFSTVVLAEDSDLNQLAVKVISIPAKTESQMKNFRHFLLRELNVLRHLHHPNVIHMLDYNVNIHLEEDTDFVGEDSEHDYQEIENILQNTENGLMQVQEHSSQLIFVNYCPGGNLFDFVSHHYRYFSLEVRYWRAIKLIVVDLLKAVDYIHNQNVIHRDIKPENVLLQYTLEQLLNGTCQLPVTCLTDFGLAKPLSSPDQLLSTRCGSLDYIAPELLMGLKYNGFLTDSWAVGVLVYCLLEDRLPFDLPLYNYMAQAGISPSVIKRRISKNSPAHRIAMIDWDWYVISDVMAEPLDPEHRLILEQLKQLVEVLLVRKEQRKTISEIMNLPEFSWIHVT